MRRIWQGERIKFCQKPPFGNYRASANCVVPVVSERAVIRTIAPDPITDCDWSILDDTGMTIAQL